ncbi:MAG: hypothetical protein IAG13_04135 [Deltaproteobacteria bacterium]|nr:hypothetical protein [Nannocystaceae bacterium]
MLRPISFVLLATFVPGCGCDGMSNGWPGLIGPDHDDDSADRFAPVRDQWRTVHEGAFHVLDDDGEPAITDLQIGLGLGYADNFRNRGDVIVELNGPPDTIKIELRRFTVASSEEAAAEVFEKLKLWAYNAKLGAPARPAQMDDETRCGGADQAGMPDPWLDACGVYVYYDGQSQLARAGADIRITLPADYRQRIGIATADNDAEDSYPNRGNVCVDGFAGTLDVEVGSALAFVKLAPDTAPMPACPQDLRDACAAFDDPATEGSDAWAIGCGCIASGYEFGHVQVESRAPSPSNMVVDVPASLWTMVSAENHGSNELAGKHCTASLTGLDDVEYITDDPRQPWIRRALVNHPPRAPATGYGVTLFSGGCDPVAAVESPEDWLGDDDDPPSNLRGDVEVCTGCLAERSCEQLLPGNE